MKVIFGIDVSKSTSTVCELINDSKSITTITNDRPGFLELLNDLKAFTQHLKLFSKPPAYIQEDYRLS